MIAYKEPLPCRCMAEALFSYFYQLSTLSVHIHMFVFRFVDFSQFSIIIFYLLHTFLIKIPLENRKLRAIMSSREKHFQSPFLFLISLFSWTPRDCLVNNPGALHFRRPDSLSVLKTSGSHYFPNPLGIFSAIKPERFWVLKSTGLGDPRGTASRAGARVYPLVGFFGIFLAETRKIPAGGTAPFSV